MKFERPKFHFLGFQIFEIPKFSLNSPELWSAKCFAVSLPCHLAALRSPIFSLVSSLSFLFLSSTRRFLLWLFSLEGILAKSQPSHRFSSPSKLDSLDSSLTSLGKLLCSLYFRILGLSNFRPSHVVFGRQFGSVFFFWLLFAFFLGRNVVS